MKSNLEQYKIQSPKLQIRILKPNVQGELDYTVARQRKHFLQVNVVSLFTWPPLYTVTSIY